MRRLCRTLALVTMLLVALSTPAAAEPLSRAEVNIRTSEFLVLLDQGRYEEAWLEMSSLFQALHNPVLWQGRQRAIRAAYGSLIHRQYFRMDFRQSYNLSPDGPHVIIQFKSGFEHKANATETVVLDCHKAEECTVREYVIN